MATLTPEQVAMLAQYLELINATTVPLTSGGDIGSPIVFAIGDSIMLGAASSLQALGITVDAQEGRQLADVVDLQVVVGQADSFVIHVGTNGTIDAGDLDAVMDSLVEVPRVVVLTVAIDRPWVEGNNDLLRALPARYPNVTVLDWAELAPECDSWLASTSRLRLRRLPSQPGRRRLLRIAHRQRARTLSQSRRQVAPTGLCELTCRRLCPRSAR